MSDTTDLFYEEVDTQEITAAPVVSSIQISELYGRYSYTIRVPGQSAPPIILLYGDNGSGKTTILNLLWNLLSPANNKGHRTAIARTPFRTFTVSLSNGDKIEVRKLDGLTGSFEIIVTRKRKEFLRELYSPDPAGRISPKSKAERRLVDARMEELLAVANAVVHSSPDARNELRATEIAARQALAELARDEDYSRYLEDIRIDPHFLADNRRIYSDHFSRDEKNDRSLAEYEYARALERQGIVVSDRDKSDLAIELTDALRRTSAWIRQQVISGTAQGSQGADVIYLDVLSQLVVTPTSQVLSEKPSLRDVIRRISELDARSKQFNEFGLIPHVSAKPFLDLLGAASDSARWSIIENVLTPYLDGQRARLDSLAPTESLIRTFVETVNGFMVNKEITYTQRAGLRIRTKDDGSILSPIQLSSGERQLVLLLCQTLLSRAESRLFIIDEPEISLNVKWQRKLLSGLLDCVQSSNVQFILATHSVEIITGHREFLARLRNRQSRQPPITTGEDSDE